MSLVRRAILLAVVLLGAAAGPAAAFDPAPAPVDSVVMDGPAIRIPMPGGLVLANDLIPLMQGVMSAMGGSQGELRALFLERSFGEDLRAGKVPVNLLPDCAMLIVMKGELAWTGPQALDFIARAGRDPQAVLRDNATNAKLQAKAQRILRDDSTGVADLAIPLVAGDQVGLVGFPVDGSAFCQVQAAARAMTAMGREGVLTLVSGRSLVVARDRAFLLLLVRYVPVTTRSVAVIRRDLRAWTRAVLAANRDAPAAPADSAPASLAPPPGTAPADGERDPEFGEYVYAEELPEALKKVPPVYPDEARNANVSGTVIVQTLVGTDGRVKDTRVVKSIRLLDAAAVAAVRQWEFLPAKSAGKPLAVWVMVPVKFTLR
jgi:protein TonB